MSSATRAGREDNVSRLPVRLLHVIGTMNPEAGGPTEAVRALVVLGQPEYASEVVTLDAPDAAFLERFPFAIHGVGPIGSVYGFTPRLLPWLRANAERFDGVVVHGLWQYTGHAVRRVFRGKKPYIVFPHGMLDPYFKHAFPRKHLKKWLYWLGSEYWTLRAADRVLFTTQTEEQLAKESFWLHRWRGLVAPLGAPEADGDLATMRAAFEARCPRVAGRRFLLFLGRIHQKKGCDLLLRAFAQLAAAIPSLHLVMAGPDQQQWSAELQGIADEAGVSDQVHWPGMLLGDTKWGALYASEAFILPSHQENFGIAVAEALGCGKAVLLSDKVNIAEEIAHDGAGFVESDTAEGVQRLLERWLALTPEQREMMGRRARICFEKRYELKRNTREILKLFASRSRRDDSTASTIPAPPQLTSSR